MARGLVECIPNFSEGRDREKIDKLARAARSVAGVVFLDLHSDPDHNRSVLTFAGPPDAVQKALLRAVEVAVRSIDLNHHRGVHPRIGAVDVVPFVPLQDLTAEECVALAVETGGELWKRFRVPVYLYEAAARLPERKELANIRRGGFERLRELAPVEPAARPDIGGPALHPTAGATAVGARDFLVAYNVNLATSDLELARSIARKIRQSNGGFPGVKALGVPLASRGIVQVTMNLTDLERLPALKLLEEIERQASQHGVEVLETEIVGLVPLKAFEKAPEFYQRAANFTPDVILENRLRALQSN